MFTLLRTPRTSIAAALVAGAGIAAFSVAGLANAAPPAGSAPVESAPSSTSAAAPDRARQAAPVRVEHQVGRVMEGVVAGADGEMPVALTLYENSLHGSSVQVVLGDPEDDRIGFVESADPFVVDGRLDLTVDVQGVPVTLRGTVVPGGRSTTVVEPVQDAGEQQVTRGTQTPLEADVTVSVGGGPSRTVAFAPAFAFDLRVRTIDLYGN